mmetsp:Transcript_7865/g.17576  ORF Transcript_7865/g.17576 Transcript_7865/m.17576 type:complete len:143 (-) Transcript_7865:675-1103(-)
MCSVPFCFVLFRFFQQSLLGYRLVSNRFVSTTNGGGGDLPGGRRCPGAVHGTLWYKGIQRRTTGKGEGGGLQRQRILKQTSSPAQFPTTCDGASASTLTRAATNQLTGTLPEDLAEKFGHLFPDHNSFCGVLLSTNKLAAPF